jgi:predicted transposase YbfD/YdcC
MLYEILVIATIATIHGQNGWKGFSRFAGAHFEDLKTVLPDLKGVQSPDAFARVLSGADREELYDFFITVSEAPRNRSLERPRGRPKAPETKGQIAIDGKNDRGAIDREKGKSVTIVVSAALNGMPLAARGVEEKSDEIKAIPPIVEALDKRGMVKGGVLSADAMGCQKEIANQINECGGDWVFNLKGNHSGMLEEVQGLFDIGLPENPGVYQVEEAASGPGIVAGRVETRTIVKVRVEGESLKWLTKAEKWKRIGSVAKVTRTFEPANPGKSREATTDTRYFISSLDVPAATLLGPTVEHWGVEVLHNRLDCSLNEDRRGVWKGYGPEYPSLVRRIALNVIVPVTKRYDNVSVNEVIEHIRLDWEYFLAVLNNKPSKACPPKVAIKRLEEAVLANFKPKRRV